MLVRWMSPKGFFGAERVYIHTYTVIAQQAGGLGASKLPSSDLCFEFRCANRERTTTQHWLDPSGALTAVCAVTSHLKLVDGSNTIS